MLGLKFFILLVINCVISSAYVIEREGLGLPEAFYDVCKEDFSNCVGAWGKSTEEEGHPCLEYKNCTTIIAFENVDDHYVFHTMTLLADNKSYVALGFSADTGMGDDGVVECIIDNKSEEKPINVYLSYNEGESTVRSENQDGLEEIIAMEENDYLYCKFNLTNSLQFKDLKVSLAGDQEYYLIGVSGVSKTDENGVVIPGRHRGSRLVSDTPLFKIQGNENELPNSFYDVCNKNFSNCFGGIWVDDQPDFSCAERKNCSTIAAFEVIDDHYVFHTMVELTGNTAYVALGLSADQKMGDDGVVECIKDDKPDKPVNTYLSLTQGHSVIRSNNQNGLEEIIAKEENNYLYCKFNLSNSLEFNDLKLNLPGDEGYYLMVVSGGTKTDDEGNVIIGFHNEAIVVSEEKLFKNDDGGSGDGGDDDDDDDDNSGDHDPNGSGHAIFAYFTLICASVVFTVLH